MTKTESKERPTAHATTAEDAAHAAGSGPFSAGTMLGQLAGQVGAPRLMRKLVQRRGATKGPDEVPDWEPREGRRQPEPSADPTYVDEAEFRAVFREVIDVLYPRDATTTLEQMFTARERIALNQFLRNQQLPAVGTFAAFFATATEAQKLLFSAALHAQDRREDPNSDPLKDEHGQTRIDPQTHHPQLQRLIRGSDCGNWVMRVIAYTRNERYRTRREMGEVESLYMNHDSSERRTHDWERDPTGTRNVNLSRALRQRTIDRYGPGAWIRYHNAPNGRPGADDHSVILVRWVDDSWNDARRRAVVVNQGDDAVGGGYYMTVELSCDEYQNNYIYRIANAYTGPPRPQQEAGVTEAPREAAHPRRGRHPH